MVEIITFEIIKKVYDEEKASEKKLSKIPENFFEACSKYLSQKRKLANNDKKLLKELENTEKIIEEIFNIRERKIVQLALIASRSNVKIENLTESEKLFLNELVQEIKNRRAEFLNLLKEKVTYITFKKDVPKFVGIDGKTYGPFKVGDKILETDLPKEIIEFLKKGEYI